jgi:uncharacterized membrane protein
MTHRIMRWLAIAALIVGYPVLAHYTNESAHYRHWGALVAIAPLVAIALVLAWRSPRRRTMLLALALMGMLLAAAWPLLEHHFDVIYWLQHAGMQLILLVVFGRTLIAGQLPLCTRFARAVHAPMKLSPEHERYTRLITWIWTAFFAMMALISTALFFLTPLATWSVFANFLTPALIALMFVAEYLVRHWALPHAPRAHILDAVRAFRDSAGHPR